MEFYGDWCVWCQRMAKTLADPQVRKALNNFHYVRMDVGRFNKHQDLLRRYGIKAVPHFIVFNPDGAVRLAQPGYCKPDVFLKFLKRAVQARVTTAPPPSGLPLNPLTPSSMSTPDQQLLSAAQRGDLPTVKRMVEQKANLNAKCSGCGGTPLEHAASSGRYEVAQYLVGRGADVNAGKHTPLHRAAQRGDIALATLLLEHKANANSRCPNCGATPLSAANGLRQTEMVSLLRKYGAR